MADAYSRHNDYGWRAFARYNLNVDGHDLFLAYRDHDRASWAVAPLTFTRSEAGALVETPSLTDANGWATGTAPAHDVRGFLQCLVDTAWEIGVRPKRLAEHQSEIAAVRYHLEDMRALAKVPPRAAK